MTDIQDEPVFADVVCARYLFMYIIAKTKKITREPIMKLIGFFIATFSDQMATKDCIAWTEKMLIHTRDKDPTRYLFLLRPSPTQPKQEVAQVPRPGDW